MHLRQIVKCGDCNIVGKLRGMFASKLQFKYKNVHVNLHVVLLYSENIKSSSFVDIRRKGRPMMFKKLEKSLFSNSFRIFMACLIGFSLICLGYLYYLTSKLRQQ